MPYPHRNLKTFPALILALAKQGFIVILKQNVVEVIAKELKVQKKLICKRTYLANVVNFTNRFGDAALAMEEEKGIPALAVLAQVALETGLPISYGIITADTLEQAIERAGTKAGNKGFNAAVDAIEMANLFRSIG